MHANLETWFIQQQVDHFDPAMNHTFYQHYLVNNRYVESVSPPIFLMMHDADDLY